MNLPFLAGRFKRQSNIQFPPADYDVVAEQVLALSRQLIERVSMTPDDSGCQDFIRARLTEAGFNCQDVSRNGVTNTWATRGNEGPMLVLAGHTDVVPPGPQHLWHSDPFVATIKDQYLFGRGAADMKTGLAALIIAAERFIQHHPKHHGQLAFAITSDEEGDAIDGTWAIIDLLKAQSLIPDWCLVGEPSSKEQVGDAIKIGRRGSLIGKIKIFGKQGHTAYADSVINPIHSVTKFMKKITTKQWDFPSRYFPATTCQFVNFTSSSGANNLTPAVAELAFNFRYSPKQTAEKLQSYVENKLKQEQFDYEAEWQHDAFPFLSRNSALLKATKDSITAFNGEPPQLSTAGGTSDGRFFSELGSHVVELGVCNKTIHQCNESVKLADLTKLVYLYEDIIKRLLVE